MPLLWLSLAFLSGIVLGEFLGWPPVAWLALAGFALALLLLRLLLTLRSRRFPASNPPAPTSNLPRFPFPLPLLFIFVALGAARYLQTQPQFNPGFIAWYNGLEPESVVVGMLVEPPDRRDTYTNLRLQVEQLSSKDDSNFILVQGLLLAKVEPGGNWRYGDRVRLQGALQAPPQDETFSYRNHLARQGIYAYMPSARANLLGSDQGNRFLGWVYHLKENGLAVLYRLFPDPEASLLAGILLGVETGIPGQVQQAFQATGTAHIIAISGFNITIVAGLFVTIFGKLLGKRRGALAAALGIALYSVLVGPSASVLRAALMGGLGLLARQVGRRQDGLNSLAFVAAVLAVFNPNILRDVGFQLSFMATLGLVLYAEPFTQAFVRVAARVLSPSAVRSVAGPVGEYFLFTLAAQLTTLPVTLYHFQRLSPVSLLANPAVLPAQPAVMVLGGLAVLLGLVWQPLGQIAAWLAWPFVLYTIRVVEFFARLPAANLALGRVTLPVVVLLYAVLFGVTGVVALRRAGRLPNLRLSLPAAAPALASAVLAASAVLTWQMGLAAPDGRLHLTLISSGGDAILLQTPAGRYVLVNGGPSPNSLSDALGRRLPVFQRQLDFVVVAGAEEEQLRALPPVVERYPMANVLWSGAEGKSRSASDLGLALAEKHIPITQAQPGHSLDLGEGAALRILAAGQRGAVLLLEWKNFHALLPIGMDEAALQALQASQLPVPLEALLLAGSGSAALNPPDWIARLQPQVVLLSPVVGGKRLPDPETLQVVQGYTLLRTDRDGWIELSTDGVRMWVEVERR